MVDARLASKSYDIPKQLVMDAYLKVQANKGAAGVDRQSLAEFALAEKDNLYKLWNRMASGSYLPAPVRAVEIPKPGGGVRILGVPTVTDRIAQTVVAMLLEPEVEKVFHPDSYGYRPGRSALDAVGVARERCWKRSWVLDMDIQGFFDNVPHEPILKAVAHHTQEKWILLYVGRWLTAPIQQPDGSLVVPDRGTPQGSAISPLLSNLFMHYAFDAWMERAHTAAFERYCDDIIVHCVSQAQARSLWESIAERLAEFGLRLHPDKTRIVYCYQDGRPRKPDELGEFTFLGYTFRPRRAGRRTGGCQTAFLPAVSDQAKRRMAAVIRSWRMGRRTDLSFKELATTVNRVVPGWITYYGRFYKSELIDFLGQRLNANLVRWACRKYKHLRRSKAKARRQLAKIARQYPGYFAHWRFGALPAGSTMGAV